MIPIFRFYNNPCSRTRKGWPRAIGHKCLWGHPAGDGIYWGTLSGQSKGNQPVWSPIYSMDFLYILHLMLIQSSQSSHEPWNIRDAQRKVTGSADSNSNWPDSKDSWVSEWVKVTHSCPTLCEPMDYTVHGILQARILEWVAFPFSSVTSQPRDQTQVSHIAGGFFTSWATREAMLTH